MTRPAFYFGQHSTEELRASLAQVQADPHRWAGKAAKIRAFTAEIARREQAASADVAGRAAHAASLMARDPVERPAHLRYNRPGIHRDHDALARTDAERDRAAAWPWLCFDDERCWQETP